MLFGVVLFLANDFLLVLDGIEWVLSDWALRLLAVVAFLGAAVPSPPPRAAVLRAFPSPPCWRGRRFASGRAYAARPWPRSFGLGMDCSCHLCAPLSGSSPWMA